MKNRRFKIRYKIFSLLLIVLMIFCIFPLSGCNKDDFNLYFGVNSMPQSIDPQRASLYSELLAVKNCFNGLMKLNTDGEPECAVANNYTISNDACTYTFYLGDSRWSNKNDVTAHDFLFAIQRACEPDTKATDTASLMNIVGAKELLSGKDAELGVYAQNDNTLVIKLLQPDSDFLYKLTKPVFMPCNKEFFENCKGKYGLGTNYIITNGNFKLASWSQKSKFVRLNRVADSDKSVSQVKSVYISMGTNGKDTITRINDGEIGITLNLGDDYTSVNTAKYKIETIYRENYIIVFNKKSPVGSNKEMTDAFAKSINRNELSTKTDSRFKITNTILPEISVINGNVIDNINHLPQHKFQYASQEARSLFIKSLEKMNNNKFPETSVITVENSSVKSALTEVVSQWQKNLGTYINIKTVPNESELLKTIKNGNFTIAYIPVSNNIKDILHNFSANGILDIMNDEYNSIVSELDSTFDSDSVEELVSKALAILSSESSIIPIISRPSAIIWDNSYKNIHFDKFDMTVDFSLICK